jgi:hydroxymethylpyrimidine/phosphomethylpyrimidine kinase
VYGCAVPVALTAQNAEGVRGIFAVPAEFVTLQIDSVFGGANVAAVKIGMLANAEIVDAVARALRRQRPAFVVLDPVISATSGARLLDDDGVRALRTELLPLVTLVTPNASEAGTLLGALAPRSGAEAGDVARGILALGARNVLVTGGHIETGADVVDVLRGECGSADIRAPRIRTGRTHGTGCRLSSAIAAYLALGASLSEACVDAQHFVAQELALAAGQADGLE